MIQIIHLTTKNKKMKKNFFFPDAPSEQLFALLHKMQHNTKKMRSFVSQAIGQYNLRIGQGNRACRIHSHLINEGIFPPFDYYFVGSSIGEENVSSNFIERMKLEDNENPHTPYIWDSDEMWSLFFDLIEKNQDKKIFISSSAPRKEHLRLADFTNVLFAAPFPTSSSYFGDDKRTMSEIYASVNLPYEVCNLEKSEDAGTFSFYATEVFQTNSLVVQATKGSGGVTENSKRALFFVENEPQFLYALAELQGEGPVRIMRKYEGIPSNTSALTLPFGTYVSGRPSVKPCGLHAVGAQAGTSSGNQWDMRFSNGAIGSQLEQLVKVGSVMANAGYYGVFGLDPIMPFVNNGNEYVFNSEINARAQGPDSQRARAALNLGLPCLEEMQIAFYLGCPAEYYPNPDEYNLITRWLRISPYLKLFPKKDQIVQNNLNGYFTFEHGALSRVSSRELALFQITGAPEVGQKILRTSPDNFLYLKFTKNNTEIFTEDKKPQLTTFAEEVVHEIYSII
jgi:hypothetical protein